jgi:hypothetical protein
VCISEFVFAVAVVPLTLARNVNGSEKKRRADFPSGEFNNSPLLVLAAFVILGSESVALPRTKGQNAVSATESFRAVFRFLAPNIDTDPHFANANPLVILLFPNVISNIEVANRLTGRGETQFRVTAKHSDEREESVKNAVRVNVEPNAVFPNLKGFPRGRCESLGRIRRHFRISS